MKSLAEIISQRQASKDDKIPRLHQMLQQQKIILSGGVKPENQHLITKMIAKKAENSVKKAEKLVKSTELNDSDNILAVLQEISDDLTSGSISTSTISSGHELEKEIASTVIHEQDIDAVGQIIADQLNEIEPLIIAATGKSKHLLQGLFRSLSRAFSLLEHQKHHGKADMKGLLSVLKAEKRNMSLRPFEGVQMPESAGEKADRIAEGIRRRLFEDAANEAIEDEGQSDRLQAEDSEYEISRQDAETSNASHGFFDAEAADASEIPQESSQMLEDSAVSERLQADSERLQADIALPKTLEELDSMIQSLGDANTVIDIMRQNGVSYNPRSTKLSTLKLGIAKKLGLA